MNSDRAAVEPGMGVCDSTELMLNDPQCSIRACSTMFEGQWWSKDSQSSSDETVADEESKWVRQ